MPSFKEAFASARKAGKSEFTWNGKRYNTKLKEDKKSTPPSSAPTPTKKPTRRAEISMEKTGESTVIFRKKTYGSKGPGKKRNAKQESTPSKSSSSGPKTRAIVAGKPDKSFVKVGKKASKSFQRKERVEKRDKKK